jgi:hypothetical protein
MDKETYEQYAVIHPEYYCVNIYISFIPLRRIYTYFLYCIETVASIGCPLLFEMTFFAEYKRMPHVELSGLEPLHRFFDSLKK